MIHWLDDRGVAVVREAPTYPRTAPFNPSEPWPEWPGAPLGVEDNPAFRAVREALHQLGLDAGRFGTPAWNPLRDLVHPGGTVVLKPNFVSHRNLDREAPPGHDATDCLVTHGSVVRAVLDYAARALGGRGRVVIGDCPIQGTRWDALAKVIGLDVVLQDARLRFPGLTFTSRDYRLTRARTVSGYVVSRASDDQRGDDYREVDLGPDSLLVPLMKDGARFGVVQYPSHRMQRAHTPERNLYVMPRDFLDADLFINLPKMKSHQKAGITCALKNLVGINGHKDYLPHFRFGSPRTGGDEYPDGGRLWDAYWDLWHAEWELDGGLRKQLLQLGARAWGLALRRAAGVPRSLIAQGGGSWHGNDTLWRTVLDINRAFLYFDRARAAVDPGAQRGYLAILDGLVGGDRESPLAPSPVRSGLLLAARNPLALDTAAAALMGLDWRKLKQLARGWELERLPLARFGPAEVRLRGLEGVASVEDVYRSRALVPFKPSHGWVGEVEYTPPPGQPTGGFAAKPGSAGCSGP